ncbi:PAS domain S-box protein [Seleniivibrio woodruffii]|uniref:PAS domain S-box protein n=1 Tax=Seleniivibrio woodruffii TaxID=1078050 RepID=UPI0024098246|nr:PAS domain S-box protein [Seleniivibrio woodruffii]
MISALNDSLTLILAAMTLSFTFLFIYYTEKMQYLVLWSIGWGLSALAIVFYSLSIMVPGMERYEMASLVINYVSSVFIGMGIYHFIYGKLPSTLLLTALIFLTFIPGGIYRSNPELAAMAVVYIFGGTVFLLCGLALIKNVKGIGSKVAGTSFTVWGVILILNLMFRNSSELAAEFIQLNVLLTMVSALGILLMHFEKMRLELAGTTLLLRELTESSKDIVFSIRLKPEPYIDYISRSATKLLGYSPEEILQDKGSLSRMINGERMANLRLISEDRAVKQLQDIAELTAKNGKVMKFDINQTLIYGMDGKPESMIGIARDMTDRELEFNRLALEKSWYELIFKSSNIMTMLVQMQTMTIIESNIALNSFYCFPKEGMRGHHIRELFLSDDDYLDFLASTNEGLPFQCRNKLPDGTQVHVTMHSSMLSYDGKDYTFITVLDNTSENYLAHELSSIKNLHRSILESLNEGVIGINSDGVIFFINNSAAQVLGYETDELLYRCHHETIHYRDESGEIPESGCTILNSLKSGGNIRNKREFLVHKDGGLIPVLLNFSTMRSEENRKRGVLIFRDITEELNSEEMILTSLEENKTLLKELHHRVKNNFQMICSLLALHAEDLPESAEKEFLNESILKILSMALTHELLFETNSFSRLGSKSYLERMISHLQRASNGADNIIVTTDIADIDLTLDEAVPCALVINELFTNSLKYASPEPERLKIHISFRQEGEGKVLVFSDNGQGLKDIESFGSKSSYGHLIIKSLTRQLKGNISFENRNGLTVTLRYK